MLENRGLLGGICLAIGGVPLALFYGFHSFGYLGMALVALGVVISYGAHIA